MSTISPIRGLTIPTVSSDSGQWGSELNTTISGLDNILGQAITFPSSQYGTNITPTSSQSQAQVFILTSSSTAAITLNFNNALGAYIVSNTTPASALLRGPNGVATISVVPNSNSFVWSNGFDVFGFGATSWGVEPVANAAQFRALTPGFLVDTGAISAVTQPVSLGSISGNFTPDFTQYAYAQATVTGNLTVNFPAVDITPLIGSWRSLFISQDATGGRTVTWSGAGYHFDNATAPLVGTTANKGNLYSLFIVSSAYIAVFQAGKNM